jgi:MFS family permease
VSAEPGEPRTLRQNLRELPATAWFLTFGAFLNRFASFSVVFLVLYLTRKGYSPGEAGFAVAAFGVGEVSASWLGGLLADRLGRRDTIALSMFSSAAALVALSQVETYGLIVVVAFLAGLAGELYRPAGAALVSDVVPPGQRVTAFAVLRLAVNVGFAGGIAVAGFLADRSFLWVFLSDAATATAFGAVALLTLPHGTRSRRRDEGSRGSLAAALSDRAFVSFLAASALVVFVYFQQQATLPLHVTAQPGLSSADFGLLLAINGVLIVLFELPVSALTMRRPAREMIALSFLLIGVGFGLTGLAHSMPALGLTVAFWTLGEMVGAPVSYAYVADLAPEHMRGRYQGIYGIAWSSGTVTGPALGTFLFARWEAEFWALCAGLGVAAAVIVALGTTSRAPVPEPTGEELEPGPGLKT